MRRLLLASLAVLLLAAAPAAAASAAFDFYARGPYHEGVPRPSDVLGYEPGTFHTTYGNMQRYLDTLARARPERVRREPFGLTVEFRERSLFIVSSPANLARLEAIREANGRLGDPRGVDAATLARLEQETPVTVWLNYSIHGDESASFEAMMQVAYQLVAGDDSLTRAILEHAVVLINPAHNPDGHERFVTWINAHGKGDPEHWALEQQAEQPWGIGGRRTHYQFDPNRDALAMSQPESQQMSAEVRRWRPQVFVDHHGQVASFFFPPTAEPTNAQLPLEDYRTWVDRFGRGNAAAFDRYGWEYYVRDVFDLHAVEYWDIWPTMQGAIGMTYETDGGGNLAYRRDDETVVTLKDGMAHHFTASLATLETAVRYRAERLRDMAAFAQRSCTPPAGGPRAYVLDPGDDPVRAAALAENLLHAGVEVRWVRDAFSVRNARPTWADGPTQPAPKDGKGLRRAGEPAPAPLAAGARAFPHGAFVVDLAQPGSRIARALLEFDHSVDTAFARAELAKFDRNVHRGRNAPDEPYGFYDITAWSLPASYGVPCYAAPEAPAGVRLAPPDPNRADEAVEHVGGAPGIPATAAIARAGPLVLHDEHGGIAFDARGRVDGGEATTAYVWSCAGDGAARLALRLLQEDFKLATATHPLRAAGLDYPRGSFIARVERNPGALHKRIRELAAASGVVVHAVNTAYFESGDTGVGSETVVSLKRPKIAVVVDRPVSPEAYGWLWFLLERRLGVRFTAVRARRLPQIELDRYNVIVVPDGGAGGLAAAFGDEGAATLKAWVQRGGALVCLDDAAEWPTLKSVGLSSAKVVGVPAPKKKDDDAEEPDASDSTSEASRRPQEIPGSIFWATLDPLHWLCWGFTTPRVPVMLAGRTMLTRSREGANAATFSRTPLTVAGWTWPDTERRLANGAFAIDEPAGDGHVVMLAGPVLFREYWRNTERFLTNALLYAPALD
ncbi:MAG TPA: M14 family zinc carboxypeptidase [Candidatus Eisenbacteria bacterium]|nr:M14 family zinc carboxypeptidase [Candidatus Eisenbacteria bacterium]